MLGCDSRAARRASSRNIVRNAGSSTSSGLSSLTTTSLLKPPGPWTIARYTTPIPPRAISATRWYLPSILPGSANIAGGSVLPGCETAEEVLVVRVVPGLRSLAVTSRYLSFAMARSPADRRHQSLRRSRADAPMVRARVVFHRRAVDNLCFVPRALPSLHPPEHPGRRRSSLRMADGWPRLSPPMVRFNRDIVAGIAAAQCCMRRRHTS